MVSSTSRKRSVVSDMMVLASFKEYNIDNWLSEVIKSLYDEATSVVLLNGSVWDFSRTTVGVRQGRPLSIMWATASQLEDRWRHRSVARQWRRTPTTHWQTEESSNLYGIEISSDKSVRIFYCQPSSDQVIMFGHVCRHDTVPKNHCCASQMIEVGHSRGICRSTPTQRRPGVTGIT